MSDRRFRANSNNHSLSGPVCMALGLLTVLIVLVVVGSHVSELFHSVDFHPSTPTSERP